MGAPGRGRLGLGLHHPGRRIGCTPTTLFGRRHRGQGDTRLQPGRPWVAVRGVIFRVPMGRCVFDLSVSAGPGQSEWAGGREKTKTGKQKTEGPPGPQGPSGPVPRAPQGGSKVVARRGVETSVGRSGGRRAGPVRSVDRVLRVVALMSWRPKRTETRLSGGLLATKLWLRRPVFVFCLGGPGPLTGREGVH